MSGPTCATCRFFVPIVPADERGHCHRYPPRDDDPAAHYGAKMWCGEHAPAEPVGVPVSAPELPHGWKWGEVDRSGYLVVFARRDNNRDWIGVNVYGNIATHGDGFPIAVVDAVLAAYRARGVR